MRPLTNAGQKSCRRNRRTGTLISVYDGIAADMDTTGGRWQTLCEDHDTICSHVTRKLAEWHAAEPAGWCEGCQAQHEDKSDES